MNDNDSQLHATLGRLGFSAIEAGIYLFLLSESPATGYRISHGIGKPTANTYKAISALQEKGAVLVDEGEKRLVRAVPPRELLARLERGFSKQCADAEELLSSIGTEKPDDRVWQLTSVPQVYERARTMIAAAEEIILADVFPHQMRELKEDFERAAARGLEVQVSIYEPVEDVSFNTVMGAVSLDELTWPGNQLNLVTDAREHLLCMFTPDSSSVHQAIWSNSIFLSCLQHNHIGMEIIIKSLPIKEQNRLIERQGISGIFLSNANPPGLRQMIEAVGERKPSNDKWGEAS